MRRAGPRAGGPAEGEDREDAGEEEGTRGKVGLEGRGGEGEVPERREAAPVQASARSSLVAAPGLLLGGGAAVSGHEQCHRRLVLVPAWEERRRRTPRYLSGPRGGRGRLLARARSRGGADRRIADTR